jgi:hypothetical protein
MKLSSTSIMDGGVIDVKYAMKAIHGGLNLSPQVLIEEIPASTRSLALVFVDRHPMARNWVHWMAVNIPPSAAVISEGSSGSGMPEGTIELENTFGFRGYGGPQPPRGSGIHSYELTAYCLSGELKPISSRPSEKEFIGMAQGMIIAKARISAAFENR